MAARRFARLSFVTAIASFFLVVLGGLVRASGAGLACPDWPLCHGRLIPPFEGLVLIEYGHRLAASLVGLLTVGLTAMAWRWFRRGPEVRTATLALVLVGVQVALGGLTVRGHLSPWLVVAHLGTAMAFFATIVSLSASALLHDTPIRPQPQFAMLSRLTVLATFALILMGGYVSASGAGLACPDWPLCYGQVLPALTGPVAVHLLHRFAAVVLGALIVGTAVLAYRTQPLQPQLVAATVIAVTLLVVQIVLGALNVELRLATAVTTAHLATAAALFAVLVVLVVLSDRAPAVELARSAPAEGSSRPGRLGRVLDYISLTKPRIIVLLLITALASMLIAAPATISLGVIFFTLLGGALSAASANAANCLLDRDIDALMYRTRRRPLPARRVEPPFAFAFATVLAVTAFVLLAVLVNLLSAVLAMGALVFYVAVYTVWLKRTTPQNIVIGGAAGAMPPLVGWAAATGRVELPAILLFLIVFLWTPPHFWALALYRREDYTRAGIPMLPVVAGEEETRRQILLYSLVLVAVTLLLYPLGAMGLLYAVSAVVLGACFLALALQVRRTRTVAAAVRLFAYSLLYLALLFAAMAADRMLRS